MRDAKIMWKLYIYIYYLRLASYFNITINNLFTEALSMSMYEGHGKGQE